MFSTAARLITVVLVVLCFNDLPKVRSAIFNCPIAPGYFPILPCQQDCQINHGRQNGTCVVASNITLSFPFGIEVPACYNCICSGDRVYPPVISKPLEGKCTLVDTLVNLAQLRGCASNCTDLDILGYQSVCDYDCACSHGAKGGTCDYKHKICNCNYGKTWKPATCQAKQKHYISLAANVTGLTDYFLNVPSAPSLGLPQCAIF